MSEPWTQPTLGGPSVSYFAISARFRWPLGWKAYLTAQMEGEAQPVELARASELTTAQLQAWLSATTPMILALMFNDELPTDDEVDDER